MSAGIVIVQQQERMVIQRFGRFDKVVGPGFRFLVPVIFNGTKVGIWERTERVPTQKYITTDNVVFPHPSLHRPEMTIKGSRNALPKDFGRIIRLIENGTIDTGPWITPRPPFDDVISKCEGYTRPETGVIKAVIEVSD